MKDTIIQYKTAVLAKEKGFIPDYVKTSELYIESGLVDQPTQSLLQKWFRNIHGIHFFVYMDEILWDTFRFNILINQKEIYDERTKLYDTYEQALEVGLFEGLKLIENDK